MKGKHPPSHVPPCRVSSPMPPPPPTPSFGWLLCIIIEWRPPKPSAPPISQFFDGCHFGAPNKGISLAPAAYIRLIGSRAEESEGKAAGGRAVQGRLILWLSVLWDCGIFCSALVPRTKLWDFLHICPTWHPSIPRRVFTSTYNYSHTK
jgi:hypothetical protein